MCLFNPSIKSMGCITSLPNINILAEKPVDLTCFFMECKALETRGRCLPQSFLPLDMQDLIICRINLLKTSV